MLNSAKSLEPAVDPNNRISFLLDWELTMKCNLDCSYCIPGLYGGHDNSTAHPPVDRCLKSIDFMFEYVDLYMANKIHGIKQVILNVYGGESLHHPDIVDILTAVHDRYKKYQSRWQLTVTTTTNAIISEKKLEQIIPLIDEFTVSYHTNNTEKQKQQFKQNLLIIKKHNRRLKCVVLMHADQKLFDDSVHMISWLDNNEIKHLPKQLDHGVEHVQFNYTSKQVKWFENLYDEKTHKSLLDAPMLVQDNQGQIDLADSGRSCCGGKQLCANQNYRSREFFVYNKFSDWYCSVNHFFLYIKQVTEEIFTNKDCKMNFTNSVGPIGTLTQVDKLLEYTKEHLSNNTMPIIQCKKTQCFCGLCAPKSQDLETFTNIMKKYHI